MDIAVLWNSFQNAEKTMNTEKSREKSLKGGHQKCLSNRGQKLKDELL